MVKNIPNLMKSMNLPVQKFQRTLSRINSRRSALRHIIIKVSEAKDNLESNKREVTHYIQGILNKIRRQFLIRNQRCKETVERHILNANYKKTKPKTHKQKNYQARILFLTKLSFKNEGEIKTFPGKKKI